MATAFSRGWPIEFIDNRWVYSDTKELNNDSRPCTRCGCYPTFEGYDACLGFVVGVTSACCGHGKEKPYTEINR